MLPSHGVWVTEATLGPKSKIATKLFPFTDTLMITFKQTKNRIWQVILTGSSFRYTRTLTIECLHETRTGLGDVYFAQLARPSGISEDDKKHIATTCVATVALEDTVSGRVVTERRVVVIGQHGGLVTLRVNHRRREVETFI